MRYYYNSKATVEASCDLTIFQLKRWGALAGNATTSVEWVASWNGKKSRIQVATDMTDDPSVKLTYAITDGQGNKTDYDYSVTLTTTKCHFGGVRFWFVCPMCSSCVGGLYLPPGAVRFSCRHCNNLSYWSRNRCQLETFGHTSRQIDKLRSEIKRWTWGGRPTRKVRRLRRLEWKMRVLSGPIWARFEKLKARIS